jgi:hypothetical protein
VRGPLDVVTHKSSIDLEQLFGTAFESGRCLDLDAAICEYLAVGGCRERRGGMKVLAGWVCG